MPPDVPGSLNLRHPEACAALAKQAIDDGAQVLRGVSDIEITNRPNPSVQGPKNRSAAAGSSKKTVI